MLTRYTQFNSNVVLQKQMFMNSCYRSASAWKHDGICKKIIAIRREDQSVWERRSPFSPDNVKTLVRSGIQVIVQPSNRRSFPMESYVEAGALIDEDLSKASVVFGVKQVPIDSLIPNKTFCFFSHTIKAQSDNMELLDACVEKNIRLIDYERLCDKSGQRVVAFGKFAGIAGMIDILHGLGLRLLALGHHTPFMHIGQAHNYRDSYQARQSIRESGYEISLNMMPKSIGPLIFVFTGSGNVSQGAQEVFQDLPHEYIPPSMLNEVAQHGDMNKVYACEVRRHDQFKRIDGEPFDVDDFSKHPEQYTSNFGETIAPYASVIINGIYWSKNTPRVLTHDDAKKLLKEKPAELTSRGSPSLPHRLLAICDISADPCGSIEFMNECTTIDEPFCLYDGDRNKYKQTFKGPGVLICSMCNMPTQLPKEATTFFGNLLLPHVKNIVLSDASKPFSQEEKSKLGPIVSNAVITSNGKLTPDYEYIQSLRKEGLDSGRESTKKTHIEKKENKKVLILGSGYVSLPVVEYLTRKNISVTVASDMQRELDEIVSIFPHTEMVCMNIKEDHERLNNLLSRHDCVVSLLPYSLHPAILKKCIETKTNMVTASYCSNEMKEMNESIVKSGIIVVNEVGADPGIDHALASMCFDRVKRDEGKVESYISYCGGLPAPEFANNPLGYKFSWSPRGVLMNMLSGARYLQNNIIHDVRKDGGLMESAHDIGSHRALNLEGYPNRDSTVYKELYQIPHAHTILRGSLRYKGYTKFIKALHSLDLLSSNTPSMNSKFTSWNDLMYQKLGKKSNMSHDELTSVLIDEFKLSRNTVEDMSELGLLSDNPDLDCSLSMIELLSSHLAKSLTYKEHESDMLIMRNEILARRSNGELERITQDLTVFGDARQKNGSERRFSAMSKCVGYPTAIATELVINGAIEDSGLIYPFNEKIYQPILDGLKEEGIEAYENSQKVVE